MHLINFGHKTGTVAMSGCRLEIWVGGRDLLPMMVLGGGVHLGGPELGVLEVKVEGTGCLMVCHLPMDMILGRGCWEMARSVARCHA